MSQIVRDLLLQSAKEISLGLSPDKIQNFLLFADELKKWNKKFNLTSIKDDRGLALKHFADSLLLLKVLGDSENLLDIGSGGGFPSIPVKIVIPQLSVVSVDAVEKKILFQRHISRILGFDNFEAVHARCEDLPSQYAGHFELIVSRAFSDIISFTVLAAPLLSKKGRMIAMKGKGGAGEATDSMTELSRMGIAITEIVYLKLPVSGEPRSFVVMEKIQK